MRRSSAPAVLAFLLLCAAAAAFAGGPGLLRPPEPTRGWHGAAKFRGLLPVPLRFVFGEACPEDNCPAQWGTDPDPAECDDLPGAPTHLWDARIYSLSAPVDGSAVSTMVDYGAAGTNLVQATGTAQPTYRATGGPGNRPYFAFDGGDFVKATAEGTSLAQPNLVALVVETNTTAAVTITDGQDSNPRTRVGLASTNAPWQLQTSSTTLSANNTITNGQWELFVGTIDGASSSIALSGVVVATGNAGAHAYAPGTIGCNFSGASCLNGGIAMAVVYDTPPDVAALTAAIQQCYGEFPQ